MIEINVRRVRNARRAVAVHASFFHLRENSLLQAVAQRGHLLVVTAFEALHRQLRSLAQRDNSRNILRSGAPRTFMPPAVKQRLKMRSLAHVKRAHALRRVHLVAGNRKRITANPLHINRNLARGLHRVRMKIDVGLRRNLSDLLDRLQHSGLVVRHHDRNQLGVGPQRRRTSSGSTRPRPSTGT